MSFEWKYWVHNDIIRDVYLRFGTSITLWLWPSLNSVVNRKFISIKHARPQAQIIFMGILPYLQYKY